MQFWPRVRSRYSYPRIRNWPISKEPKIIGFAGYKVGMSHSLILDNTPNSLTKGSEIFCPVTILECPPLKTDSIIFYKKTPNGSKIVDQKNKQTLLNDKLDFDFLRLLCYTQPNLASFKKKPEFFEVAVGGNKEQQLTYANEKLGKEIGVNEAFKEGQLLDVHSITKGKGFQGPVKRFGIMLRHHKSEKSRRNPGSLGAWRAQGKISWRTAHAGKMGYHLRTEYNKWIVKIGTNANEINVKGGFIRYGNVKNNYMLIKGSVGGSKKRLIRLTTTSRIKSIREPPQITYMSTESKQGR